MPSESSPGQQVGAFDAQLRSELLARQRTSLGSCTGCGEPVRLEDDFMTVDDRVAHVDCRPQAPRARPGS